MLRWTRRAKLWLAIASCLVAAPASALVIGPGEALEVSFSLSGPATGANTLAFRLISVSATDVSTMTVELYDGATLLGSVASVPVTGIAGFVDAGSLWTTNAVSTNLSSVRSGAIAGTIRVLPDFLNGGASLTAGVSQVENISLAVGSGTDSATIVPLTGLLAVGEAFAVPEPGSLALLGIAAVLGARPRARTRA